MGSEPEVIFDDDNPEWTDEDFALARPANEVLSAEECAMFVRQPGVPFKRPVPIKGSETLRLSPDVLAALRAGGPGWQTRADAILRQALLG